MILLMIIVDEGKVIFDFAAQNVTGVPNGMTVDTEGNLWVACLKSSHVSFDSKQCQFLYSQKLRGGGE